MPERLSAPWAPTSAWANILAARRSGPAGAAGILVEPIEGVSLATVIAAPSRPAGDDLGHHAPQDEEVGGLAAKLEEAFGARPPIRPAVAEGGGVAFVWSGPESWLAVAERRDLAARLEEIAGGLAAIVDQTDSRALLRLTGPHVRDALAKGCPIDLHPLAFRPGDAAVTAIAHIGVQLWRPDEASFVIAVSRSYAGSFWSWLSASAAEFGCEVRQAC